jgi:8-oxo-dGTP pyrophosphatase MutT (NUDIX family)
MSQLVVRQVKQLDLSFEPWSWPFASENSKAIADIFAAEQARKPALFNGRILLMRDPVVAGEVLSARYFESDFATYLAWREFGFPGDDIYSGFGMGALRDADGVYLMGEMAPHTANAGRVYFPSGTPDPSDLADDRVDIAGSIVREVEEETGLTPDDYVAVPEFHCVIARPAVAIIQVLEVKAAATVMKQKILANLAGQAMPEFSAVHLIRDARDITETMPRYVSAFVREMTAAASA